MATVETFGVDQAYVQSYTGEHIKIDDDVDAMLTTTRFGVLRDRACGDVAIIIAGVHGTGAVATFVANKSATAEGAAVYAAIQGCVMDFLWPMLLPATHGMPAVAEDVDEIAERVRLKVENMRQHPEDLGTPDITDYSLTETTTATLGIDTTVDRPLYDSYTDPSSGRRKRRW